MTQTNKKADIRYSTTDSVKIYMYNIGATIRIGQEIQCLPYAGFFLVIALFFLPQSANKLNLDFCCLIFFTILLVSLSENHENYVLATKKEFMFMSKYSFPCTGT